MSKANAPVPEMPQKKKALVVCAGITTKTGFNAYPPRTAPTYCEFVPGKPTELDEEVAAYLVAADPAKFSVVEAKASEKKDAAKKDGAK